MNPIFLTLVVISIISIIFFVPKVEHKDEHNQPELICKDCGSLVSGEEHKKGSGSIEIVLWLLFLLPGLIYSMWRTSGDLKHCEVCKSINLIPQNSPEGERIRSRLAS